MAPLEFDVNVAARGIATMAPLTGCENMVLIIRNTFIEASRLRDDSKRSSSVPRAMNWIFPGENSRLGSSPADAGDKGNHGEQETPSAKSQYMPEGQSPLSAQAPQAHSSTESQDMAEGQHTVSAQAPQAPQVFRQSRSIGSQGHDEGLCNPCAWLWKNGCARGAKCGYCHLCGDGELKARRKLKTKLLKNIERQHKRQAADLSNQQTLDTIDDS